MIYRLLMFVGAAIMLVGEPAMADFVLRIDHPSGHPAPEPYDACTENGFYDGSDPRRIDDRFYPPFIGPYGYDGYDNHYPILPSPLLVPAPVVVPPIIARPVSPQPRILRYVPGYGWISEPNPRFHRILPAYPDFLTSGSAYYPTPTYPFSPRIRVFPRHHRR